MGEDLLLIVPYGIETLCTCCSRTLVVLLIVPYGIETTFPCKGHSQPGGLLIVPYGIETQESARWI